MGVADEVVVRFRVEDAQYNAALARDQANFSMLVGKMEADAKSTGAALSRIGEGAKKGFAEVARDAPRASTSIRGAGVSASMAKVQMQNLSFQTQDVVQQIIAGQSPLGILSQQLFQITQYGGSLTGVMGALKNTIGALVSPLGLATTAFVVLGSVAVSYISDLLEGGEDTEKTLKEHMELINRVAEKWGEAVPALKAYVDELNRAKDVADAIKAGEVGAASETKKANDQMKELTSRFTDLVENLQSAGASADEIVALQRAFKALQADINDNVKTVKNLDNVNSALVTLYKSTGIPVVKEYADSFADVSQQIRDATAEAAKMRQEAKKLAEDLKVLAAIEALPSNLGQLSPVYSGGGKFLNQGEFQNFRASQGELAAAGESIAASIIKELEGFRPGAYWDVNAYRAGFGSDTTTDAAGNVSKVLAGTVVSLEDANRDLARRILEFQDTIRGQIGNATFQALSEEQKAALTSIAYNYGSLPDRIVNAINGGKSTADIATAIANLGSDNAGINKERRLKEAQMFGGDVGFSKSEFNKKTPEDLFQGNIDQVQKRIDMLNAELEATKGLTAGTDEYALAVEKARIEAQLLADAKSHDLTITPELAAQISTLAENYAKASVGARGLRDANKDLAKSQEEIAEFGKDVLGGFISDLREGKSGAEALANALEKVADKLLEITLDALFSTSGGGFGSIISAIFGGIGKRERGGPVTAGKPYIVGEKRPELFVPSQSGSIIPQVPTAGAVGGRGGGSVEIMVKSVRGEMFDTIVDTRAQGVAMNVSRSTIGAYDKQLSNTLGARMRLAQDRQN